MATLTFYTFIILLYVNAVRFVELRHNTTMITWRDYWINMSGIVYNLNIILIFVCLLVVEYFKK